MDWEKIALLFIGAIISHLGTLIVWSIKTSRDKVRLTGSLSATDRGFMKIKVLCISPRKAKICDVFLTGATYPENSTRRSRKKDPLGLSSHGVALEPVNSLNDVDVIVLEKDDAAEFKLNVDEDTLSEFSKYPEEHVFIQAELLDGSIIILSEGRKVMEILQLAAQFRGEQKLRKESKKRISAKLRN